MAAIPALAQASSASPPGAPETPIAPTSEPPASTTSPPPMTTTPGRWRIPACIMPGWLMVKRLLVLLRKEASVEVGMRGRLHRLGADTSEAALLALIKALNDDDAVDGILVQLPLPKTI